MASRQRGPVIYLGETTLATRPSGKHATTHHHQLLPASEKQYSTTLRDIFALAISCHIDRSVVTCKGCWKPRVLLELVHATAFAGFFGFIPGATRMYSKFASSNEPQALPSLLPESEIHTACKRKSIHAARALRLPCGRGGNSGRVKPNGPILGMAHQLLCLSAVPSPRVMLRNGTQLMYGFTLSVCTRRFKSRTFRVAAEKAPKSLPMCISRAVRRLSLLCTRLA